MIFWIFVIIFVLAFIIFLAINDEKDDKLWQLQKEKEKWRVAWLTLIPSDPNYEEIREKYYAADSAYDEYKISTQERINTKESISNTAIGFMIGSFIVILFMLIGIICCAIKAPMERARLEAEHEVLAWEVQNAVYNDDDDVVGHKETFNQVREWNANLAKKQAQERNFWIGIFVPNIYGDLEPIALPEYD